MNKENKQLLLILAVFLLGAFITASVDTFLGLDTMNVFGWKSILHKLVYMFWGGFLMKLFKEYYT